MSSNNDAYKNAGVDIEAGNQFVQRIKGAVKSTYRSEVLGDLGGFGGLFALNAGRYKRPVLVSGTDGVGTKLRVAQMANRHGSVGIDLVAMCVNDIVVQGAEPLFFLDYVGVGRLNPEAMALVVEGIAEGCRQAGCALIGGETAEMPGMYQGEDYDLAGFAVGVVDQDAMIQGNTIQEGDVLIGLPSSGLHSNGYSLVRKILFDDLKLNIDSVLFEGKTVAEELLTPTRIYVRLILDLMNHVTIKGLVHVTGGGFLENIPRILPAGLGVSIRRNSWPVLPIFSYLQEHGHLSDSDLYRTFNMGIGMIMVLSAQQEEAALKALAQHNESAYVLGRVTSSSGVDIV